MKPLFTTMEQINLVVDDVEKVVDLFANKYGIGPWMIVNFGHIDGDEEFNSHAVKVEDAVVYGKKTKEYACTNAVCTLGDFQIELVQPIDEENVFAKFRKERGIGGQHIAIDNTTTFTELMGIMAKNGFPLAQLSKVDEVEDCAFIDHRRLLGLDLELHNRPGGFRMPDVQYKTVEANPNVKPLFCAIDQLGFVVEDLEETVHLLADEYGIGPWMLMNFGDCHDGKPFISVEDAVVNGKDIGTYGVKAAICDALNVQIELLEPVGEDDIEGKFLKEKGPGLHHISIRHEAPYEEALKQMQEAGYTDYQQSTIDGQELCGFADHSDLIGIYLEIHKRAENFTWPDITPEFYPAPPSEK